MSVRQGDYVRLWVPELSPVKDGRVHLPWALPPSVRGELDYPPPMVMAPEWQRHAAKTVRSALTSSLHNAQGNQTIIFSRPRTILLFHTYDNKCPLSCAESTGLFPPLYLLVGPASHTLTLRFPVITQLSKPVYATHGAHKANSGS